MTQLKTDLYNAVKEITNNIIELYNRKDTSKSNQSNDESINQCTPLVTAALEVGLTHIEQKLKEDKNINDMFTKKSPKSNLQWNKVVLFEVCIYISYII